MSRFNIKLTAAEHRAIEHGYFALDRLATAAGSSGAAYLQDAIDYETKGKDRFPLIIARGWSLARFMEAYNGKQQIIDLFGMRPSAIGLHILAAKLIERNGSGPAPVDLFDDVRAGAQIYTDAFHRHFDTKAAIGA